MTLKLNTWNNLSDSPSGRFMIIPAPSSMYGAVKSITCSRSDVMVNGPTAKSTSCKELNHLYPLTTGIYTEIRFENKRG